MNRNDNDNKFVAAVTHTLFCLNANIGINCIYIFIYLNSSDKYELNICIDVVSFSFILNFFLLFTSVYSVVFVAWNEQIVVYLPSI